MTATLLSMDIKETLALIALIFAFISTFLGIIYSQITKHEETRNNNLIPWLEKQNTFNKYQSTLEKLLNKLQQFYGPANSFKAFNVSLMLAYLYPLLFFIIAYSFLGGSHEFSGFKTLPEQSNFRWLYAPAFLVISFIIYFSISKNDSIEKKASLLINQSLSLSLKNSTILFKVTSALLSIGIASFSGFPILNILSLSIVAYILPVLAIVGAFAFIGVGIGTFTNAFIGALSIIFSSVIAGSATFTIVIVAIVAVVVAARGNYEASLFFFIFIIIFPFINATLDWVSWRVSRFFLRHAKQQDKLWEILVDIIFDLAVAIALMLALCLLMPLGIEGVNWIYALFSDVKIDWQKMALETHNDPWGKGAMITLMLVTTLIPTMIHIGMALFAIVVNSFGGLKLAALLTEANETKDNIKPMKAAVWLFAYYLIVIMLMVGFYWAIMKFVDFPVADWLYNITAYFYNLPALKP